MSSVKRRVQESVERANPVAPVHFWQSPAGASVDIFLITHLDVYSAMHEHAISSLPNETGGFLLGRVAFAAADASWHIEVDETIPVEPLAQDPVHFSFTWRDVDRVRSYRESKGKALLGWYHTHPDLGIFLSATDLEKTHRVLFAEPFQLALVYDPVRGRAGYFFWEGRQIIDASRAPWREFEIAVGSPEPAAGGLDDPTESTVVGADDSTESVAVGPNGPSQSGEAAPESAPAPAGSIGSADREKADGEKAENSV